MVLSKGDTDKIIAFVRKEPCLIQDIASYIGKSWVTAERYVSKISKDKGLIRLKTFREGTKGAIKVAYWNYPEIVQSDELRMKLFEKIKNTSNKKDFDALEIFQFVNPRKARVFYEHYTDPLISEKQRIIPFLMQTKDELFIFSGNLSFLNIIENKKKVISALEELLKRKVLVKILCRVDVASLSNINLIEKLIKKHTNQIELRHCLHPLRGFIIDNKSVRLKEEKSSQDFKKDELEKNMRIFYEIYDAEWVDWMQNVFWNLFRNSIDYKKRINIIEKIMVN